MNWNKASKGFKISGNLCNYGKGSKPGRRYVSLLCLEKGLRLVILSSSAFAKGKEKERDRVLHAG